MPANCIRTMSKNPAAILDVDGTLFQNKYPLTIEFAEYLGEIDEFDPDLLAEMKDAINDYKSGSTDAVSAVTILSDNWCTGIAGMRENRCQSLAAEFMEEFREEIPEEVYELIDLLDENDYDIYLISGSAHEALEALSDELSKVKAVYGTQVAIENEFYVDQLKREYVKENRDDTKEMHLSKIFERSARSGSISLGDHVFDIPIFMEVDYPFAIDPSEELAKIATEENWPIYNSVEHFVDEHEFE